jgi:hypothetical protein
VGQYELLHVRHTLPIYWKDAVYNSINFHEAYGYEMITNSIKLFINTASDGLMGAHTYHIFSAMSLTEFPSFD